MTMRLPKELKFKYLTRRLEEVHLLESSLNEGDFTVAERVGHQLKGNAVTFEIPQIAYIGHEMERAAQMKDTEKLKALIKKLHSSLESVRVHWLGSEIPKEDFNDLRT